MVIVISIGVMIYIIINQLQVILSYKVVLPSSSQARRILHRSSTMEQEYCMYGVAQEVV